MKPKRPVQLVADQLKNIRGPLEDDIEGHPLFGCEVNCDWKSSKLQYVDQLNKMYSEGT